LGVQTRVPGTSVPGRALRREAADLRQALEDREL
jgi:hypothetical protein